MPWTIENAPRDDLVRMVARQPLEIRADENGRPRLAGHFAVFNEWTEIDSWYEGRFLEQIAPGAFRKTFKENRAAIKCIYEHGMDFEMGNKPLGPAEILKEDQLGAYYEVPLIDTDYNRDFVIPAAEAGLLGASFRFKVMRETWEDPNDESKLPRRTVQEVKVYEFGPCPFPAYEAATAGIRSRLDFALWQQLDEQGRKELVTLMRQAHSTPDQGAAQLHPVAPAYGHPTVRTTKAEALKRVLAITGVTG